MTYKDKDLNISAYVDNELTKKQKQQFEEEMIQDTETLEEVSAYVELKDKIKLSYNKEHSQHYKNFHSCDTKGSFLGNCKQAVAAAVVLGIGLFTLNNLSLHNQNNEANVLKTAQIENAPKGFKLTPVKFDQNKLLIHISSSDEHSLQTAMDEAESLLEQYEKNDLPLQLEVIANSSGVDLMRASVSPYANKIRELQQRYEQVQFVACINTLKRLEKNGESTKLLPGVTADLPVVDKILGRMQEGWTYIKI